MTVSTFHSSTADGWIESASTVYATARAGSGMFADTAGAYGLIGQSFYTPTYYLDKCFLAFDTSAIPDSDVIESSVLSLYGKVDSTAVNPKLQVAVLDWSAGGLTTADWQDGTELAALTPIAQYDTASGFSIVGYNDFVEITGGLSAAINKTGITYLVAFTDRLRAGNVPAAVPNHIEYVEVWMGDDGAAGTTRDPKLVVTHTAGELAARSSILRAPGQTISRASNW